MVGAESRVGTIRALARRLRQLETGTSGPWHAPVAASGIAALDGLLPEGGLPRGALTEWLTDGDGVGTTSLALMAAHNLLNDHVSRRNETRQPSRSQRTSRSRRGSGLVVPGKLPGPVLVVIDAYRQFYAPAAVRLGLPLEQILLVRPQTPQESLWAWEQCLRCPGVLASVCWSERIDGRVFRRLQLAVERGGGVAQLVRPLVWQREPSWARVRLRVASRPQLPGSYERQVEVSLVRGGPSDRTVSIRFNDNGTVLNVLPPSGQGN